MPEQPPIIPQPKRPDQIEDAPSALRIVVYAPEGKVLYSEYARLKQFSTGSWGYHTAGKIDVPRVEDQRLQVNCILTVIGSKGWGKED